MLESSPMERPGSRRIPPWVMSLLGAAAVTYLGFRSSLALSGEDVDKYESPLMLSVARQLVAGPWGLYGPFGGSNPLVLIHAPLYYRAAGLLAWPIWRAGLHPADAARIAGRALSAASLIATLAAAYRLGRLGGLPRRAGWWAALLVAAAPVLAGMPVAVRPDMAGVALQSWGAALALGALAPSGHGPGRRLVAASVLFGLAACVKQHLVAGWGVSAGLAAWGWARGRLGLGTVAAVVLPGAAVAAAIYGAEWVATAGRVWEAAFLAAANVGRVHPGGWDVVFVLLLGIANRSAGTVAVLAAGALIAIGGRPGLPRWIATGVATIVVGILLGAVSADVAVRSNRTGAAIFLAVGLAAAVVLPAAALSTRSSSTAKEVDAALWAYLAAELGLVVLLSRTSAGAWIYYGIPATVFAAALAARALSRALDADAPPLVASPALLASAVILVTSLNGVNEARWDALVERALDETVLNHLHLPRSSYFFTGRPGFNRCNGRLELVYDDWLYPVFERIGLAEPRSRWLRRAMVSGPVRVVVKGSKGPEVEGTTIDLRRLGYRLEGVLEPYFYVWIR
jgi:hypothetical protein